MPVRLGELLLKEEMATPRQIQAAREHQKLKGGSLPRALVTLGVVTDEEIGSLLSRAYGVPLVDLDNTAIEPVIPRILPLEMAEKYQVLPISRKGATLTVAMADPTNVFAQDEIKFYTGYNVEAVVAPPLQLEKHTRGDPDDKDFEPGHPDYGLRRDGTIYGVRPQRTRCDECGTEINWTWFLEGPLPRGSQVDATDPEGPPQCRTCNARAEPAPSWSTPRRYTPRDG